MTPGLLSESPHLFNGVIIATDRKGSRLLIAVYRPRQRPGDAAAAIAPDVTLEPVEDYVHDQLQRGARDGDPARGRVDAGHPGHAP